jgi:Protein of unknown function (DUF1571)
MLTFACQVGNGLDDCFECTPHSTNALAKPALPVVNRSGRGFHQEHEEGTSNDDLGRYTPNPHVIRSAKRRLTAWDTSEVRFHMARKVRGQSCRKPNALALVVASTSILLLYGSFDPVPAGEEIRIGGVAAAASLPVFTSDVPLPPNTQTLPIAEPAEGEFQTVAAPVAQACPTGGCILSNNDALKFTLLLLNDGERFLANSKSYTTRFTKQERIGGDLSDDQIIDLKIRHEPYFSVYMKWRNGDTGRQLLYSDEYDDQQMVVKLGGFKGRLLPAIKLDPLGDRAMSESRYPVTEAGILGMLRQIQTHRRDDLSRGHGVECRRLPNQQFDERDCYCFEYTYESPERSPVYRRSVILIDTRYHIPLVARNYTWAVDADGLTARELDERTLVESYSFSALNFGKELVAVDFSRKNPRYRM